MRVLRIHHRLTIFFTAALLLACIISPWLALGADWFATQWPELLSEPVSFNKAFTRAFMIAGVILFIAYHRNLNPAELTRLLNPGLYVGLRNFFTGWGLAVLSMVLLVAAMTATDVFTLYFRQSLTNGSSRFASAFSIGIFVGFLEEIFFRGILFLGIRETGHGLRAYMVANLVYAAVHFVKPGKEYFLEGVNLFAGFRHLITTFESFLDPVSLLPGMIGLFLIGVVLSYALARTGDLWLSIGLHAGWVLSLKILKLFGNFSRADLGWVFGAAEPKIVSGMATWIGVVLVGLAVSRITRRRSQAISLTQQRLDFLADSSGD